MKRQKITLKQLECLIALEKTLHFREAAQLLDIQQPSLSLQIQNLEEALGIRLVERSRSGVAFTAAGRDIAEKARTALSFVQDVVDYAARAQNELSGTIRLGTTPTLGPYFLPFVVRNLHKKNRDLNLYVRESGARDLEYELIQGTHDLILTQISTRQEGLIYAPLFQEPLYLALSLDHPLAKKDILTIQDIKGQTILSLSPSYHLHDQVARLCESYGAFLSRDYEGTSLDALRQMVGMDMGATFLPALYIHSEIKARSEIVVKNIKGRTIGRQIGLAWRKNSAQTWSYKQIAEVMRSIAERKFSELIDLK